MTIVAERILTLSLPNGPVPVPVRIHAPLERDGAWFCRFEIVWPDGPAGTEAGGVESAQALLGAFTLVGVHLYASSAHKTGKLHWQEPGAGYGFPVTAHMRDDLIGYDARFL